ncbi:unnamed protein product [Mytilus coruscus]|uniref:Integrase catalytic domain-containing protein n=1 Tax=Mytilus coruscus TaxID=42192 RepID=A0A6J8EF61_MYTCO|nr:unnamed protein product [Mytilus coruscus]
MPAEGVCNHIGTEGTSSETLPSHIKDLFNKSTVHLQEKEKQQLKELLHVYSDVFAKSADDLGRTNRVQHRINTGTALPIRQAPRRLPLGKREIEKKEIVKMLDRGVIEPSNSPWSFRTVLIAKKDGSTRVCVDYRALNELIIHKDAYPLPRVDDCLDSLAGAKWFGCLDLNQVTPFGLATSPAVFERLIEDVLRGLQWEECLLYMDDIIVPGATFEEELLKARAQDENIWKVFAAFEAGSQKPPWESISSGTSALKTLWGQWNRLETHGGVLNRRFETNIGQEARKQMIVPKSRTQDLLHYFHDVPSAAHLGVDKTLEKLKNGFYWPNMKEYVQAYCRSCDGCFARKPKKESTKAPLGTYISGEPMERVALDIFGPLTLTKRNNKYILVISDLFTKWTEAIALPNQESSTICTAFIDHFVTKFGALLQLHSDQGRNFQADIFQRMCKLLGIQKTRTTSFRPQSNGGVERFNRTLASMLSIYCKQNQDQWDQYLQQDTKFHVLWKGGNFATAGCDSTEIQENRSPDDYVAHLQNKLKENHAFARNALKKVSVYQKKRYGLNAKKRIFKRGEAVWIYDPIRKKGIYSKLTPQWKGPFIIEKRIYDVTYRVKGSVRQPSTVYHVDRLALYQGRNVPL